MNWWMVLQIIQWVAQVNGPPAGYLLRDDVFFAQSPSQQLLTLDKPDTLLLDIALFQATNEARRQAGLPILYYDRALYQAARNHAESMIQHNYYGHENLYSLPELTLTKRVQIQTKKFGRMAENIGQYQTIVTPEWFGARFNARTHQYEYIDSETKQLFGPHTYASYARYAVVQWLNSPIIGPTCLTHRIRMSGVPPSCHVTHFRSAGPRLAVWCKTLVRCEGRHRQVDKLI